jgi:nucleotide-binding universal stress UspA family protein
MAVRNDAKIHVLHVLQLAIGPQVTSPIAAQPSQVEQYMKDRVDKFVRQVARDPDLIARIASVEVVVGDPINQILQTAKKRNVDAIVMGTHSKGPIAYTLLGSVAAEVLRFSRRPVIVIPLPEELEDEAEYEY